MRVAIAEDAVLLREGLSRLLGDEGFEVVGQCGDADDLLLKVRSYPLDVVIVDVRLPPTLMSFSRNSSQVRKNRFPRRPLAVAK